MTSRTEQGRRPVIFWAVCPECLTYIWVDGTSIADEENAACPYCELPISLEGGAELADSCRRLQALIEDVEQQIAAIPAAVDVHRFFANQIEFIAAAFNDKLDRIESEKNPAGYKL